MVVVLLRCCVVALLRCCDFNAILKPAHTTPRALGGVACVPAERLVVVSAVDGLVLLKGRVVGAVVHVLHVAGGRGNARAVVGGLHVPRKHLKRTH